MRTSKQEVYSVFRLWLCGINAAEAKSYSDVDGYRLDYNPYYGGYRVERICNISGGVQDIFNYRLKAWEFVTALRMSMRSIEELRLNCSAKKVAL